MRKDILFEKVIQIVQESFKDHENTKIIHQYKIPNTSGRKREIDVFIETKVNNIVFRAVIECKDYKRKVEAKDIESFHSKCLRIPEIHKKIFVSRNGYQVDAKNAANDFQIDLYTLDQLKEEDVKNWLTIPMFQQVYIEREILRTAFILPEKTNHQFLYEDILHFDENYKESAIFFLKNNIPNTIQFKHKEDKAILEFVFKFKNTFIEKDRIKFIVDGLIVHVEYRKKELESKVTYDRFNGNGKDSIEIATSITNEFGDIVSLVKKEGKEEIEIYREKDGKGIIKFGEIKIEKIDKKNGS